MAVPDYQSLMLPLLKYAGDGEEHKIRNAIEHLAEELRLSEEERRELLPSGQQAVFNNRIGWARTYLKKAGLLASGRKGYFSITQRGLNVLKDNPAYIDVNFLTRYKEFNEFRRGKQVENIELGKAQNKTEQLDPWESLELSYQQLHNELVLEILSAVKKCSPTFFESTVIDVLTKMGYGGSRADAGKAVGRSHDGGIDGIIKEDRLGLDVIYIQAKRWEGTVPRPEIQKFAGALIGKKAKKGVFITTSTFSREALEYANFTGNIVLIDGETLARLMIEYDVGVSKVKSYDVKKIDTDYFDDGLT
ncbi:MULTISPECIES: restriction endonuclease [Methanosarcina]|uniref:Mrr restriction system protein n=1 Tax=Methanosarcina vacuolata Z-761 TaxID=1434123 RepID=A0A0E3Q7N5_9EURY|nr:MULTISPECIES: restriction endonuclease [Methanosarcina]AKB45677.1 Mrr restriction system protein [Methanosarcina vacuolata Z-761]AKB49144.1 Mrr restriction system protein [Methanosarcina sp. Kolksee]